MADPRFRTTAIEKLYGRCGSPFDGTEPSLHRSYFIEYDVITTDKRLGSNTVVKCPGIPRPYSPYITDDGMESDLYALAVRVSVEKRDQDDAYVHKVRVDFSTKMPPGGPADLVGWGDELVGAQNNPELIPPVIKWDKETVSRALPYDLDGKPFVNAAGQPFSPAPTFETSRAVLVIIRNELIFTRQTATGYSYAVNSDPFLGAKPGCVRCDTPVADEEWLGDLPYFRVTYRLVFGAPKFSARPNPVIGAVVGSPAIGVAALQADDLEEWQPEFLNQGTMRKPTVFGITYPGGLIPIMGYAGPVTHPVLLNDAGQPATRDADGKIPATFIKFRTLQSRSFTNLLRGAERRVS